MSYNLFEQDPREAFPNIEDYFAIKAACTDDYRHAVVSQLLAARETLRVLAVVVTGDIFMSVLGDGAPGSGSGSLAPSMEFTREFAEGQIADPRFCVVKCDEFKDDWLEGAWGGDDFWTRAEERVRERFAVRVIAD